VHRDLRADNVFIFHDEVRDVRCKVGDFGLSRQVDARSVAARGQSVVKEGYYYAPDSCRFAGAVPLLRARGAGGTVR
jgi:serine/threonine protein kinase